MLDIKYTKPELYEKYVGCELGRVMDFLNLLEKQGVSTWLRQVIIPTINDTKENALSLKEIAIKHSVVERTELLHFRKICQTKYDLLGRKFQFSSLPEPSREQMKKLEEIVFKSI